MGEDRLDRLMRENDSLRRRLAELELAQTEQKRMESALRASEGRARTFFESASEGIVIVDRHGRIVLANPRAEAIFGYEGGELAMKPVEILVPERLREVHRRYRVDYLMNPSARRIRGGLAVTGRRKDGVEIPVEVSLSSVETDEGLQAAAFITDVSARVAAERAARQADRLAALGAMGAGVAHEINNPVGIMISRIELMLADAESQGLPPALVDDLEVLRRNAERVARIAHGLLSFSRESPGEREPVDLNRVVTETLLLAERQIGKQGVRIITHLHPALPVILGQGAALEQVLLNLLTNASEAMGGCGEIRIETGFAPWPPGSVRLRVTDTGPGILPDALPRIFDPFYTTKPSGTGLGLSISYGIVREHRGTLDVESQPGRGTSFTLTFPRFGAEID